MEDPYFTVAKIVDDRINVSRKAVDFTIVKPGESLLVQMN